MAKLPSKKQADEEKASTGFEILLSPYFTLLQGTAQRLN